MMEVLRPFGPLPVHTMLTQAIFVRPSRCVEEECDAARNFLGPKERYPCRQPIHLSNWY